MDELIKDDVAVKKKIITDSSAKKWHILMIVYLVATLFMLFFELRIFMCKGETNEITCDRYTKRNNR